MALGDLTKQIAQHALLSATKEQPAPVPADSAGGTMLAQIAAMQRSLKEDEELVVLFESGGEKIKLTEIFMPSPQVAVLSGMDANQGFTRVVSAVAALQLVCRTVKVAVGTKPARVGLFTPKPKDSSG